MKSTLKIPGFVDLQVNGFVGVDFSTEALTEDGFIHAARTLLDRGTAAFLPTLITNHEALLRRNLTIIVRALKKDAVLARHILGFHLEGPFISAEPARSAHTIQRPCSRLHVRPSTSYGSGQTEGCAC